MVDNTINEGKDEGSSFPQLQACFATHIMMFYFKANAYALCSHLHALGAHVNAFHTSSNPTCIHCGEEECIGGEKVPEDQEICYCRDFAPISNVDVS